MLPFIRSDLATFSAYVLHTEPTGPLPDVIDQLDTNESPYDLPAELKQKLAWTWQTEIASNRYPDGGHARLKGAIAAYVTEAASLPANAITAAQISVGNGSDELIRSLLIATCLRGEGQILVAEPTFSMYAILAETLGIPVTRVGRSRDTWAIDLAAARGAIAQAPAPPIRAVFVVHPNSPTGNALTPAEQDWLRQLPDDVLVVIDEAYFEFSQQTLVGELAQHPNWVILRTFSKALRLAAHRVGYAIAHPDLIAILEKVRLPYNLPSFTQAAALTALTHRGELLPVIPTLLAQRAAVFQALQAVPELTVWPSAANFLYVQLAHTNEQARLAAMCDRLKQQGTRIRHTGGGLRLTIGTPAENERLVARLKAAIAMES